MPKTDLKDSTTGSNLEDVRCLSNTSLHKPTFEQSQWHFLYRWRSWTSQKSESRKRHPFLVPCEFLGRNRPWDHLSLGGVTPNFAQKASGPKICLHRRAKWFRNKHFGAGKACPWLHYTWKLWHKINDVIDSVIKFILVLGIKIMKNDIAKGSMRSQLMRFFFFFRLVDSQDFADAKGSQCSLKRKTHHHLDDAWRR